MKARKQPAHHWLFNVILTITATLRDNVKYLSQIQEVDMIHATR